MDFTGKVALITGGGGGIGRATALGFALRGAKVMVVDADATSGQASADIIAQRGGTVGFVQADVTQSASVQDYVRKTMDAYGRIDCFFNNAGIEGTVCPTQEYDEAVFDHVIAVNLKGVFLAGQAAARQMVKQGAGGAIVNMSSVNAVLAIANQVPYVVSKGGINQLTRVMAIALAPHAIRVNAVGPGTILTELAKTAVMGNAEAEARILSRTPLGRMGEPAEIASAALFLVSDDASYMTGQCIYPDGGRLALNYTMPVPQ